MRVGILGHVGNENLGDESIIAAVIQNIRRRFPDAEINGFTLKPDDTQARHGIVSFPIRQWAPSGQTDSAPEQFSTPEIQTNPSLAHRVKTILKAVPILSSVLRSALAALETLPGVVNEVPFLLQCRQRVKGLDLLIFAGSHQLNDFVGGPWRYPYTVFKWTLLAKAAGADVVFLSLGAGPIDSWLGRRFIRHSLKSASYRSYRDVTAKKWVDGLGGFDADKVEPDLAFSLDSPVALEAATPSGGTVVGINPMPLYTDYWHEVDEKKYKNYVAKLAAFADWLVARGCEVRLIPTQLKVDPAVVTAVVERMANSGKPEYEKLIVQPKIQSLDELRSALAGVDIMVATRYHGIVLSLALSKPVLAIAYHDKSRDLMRWMGQSAFVIEGDSFTLEELTDRITLLEEQGESISSALAQQLPDFQSAVQAQYDTVLGLRDPTNRS
jgi:polysaccharide pyruvyl transferase WcaK-like protein